MKTETTTNIQYSFGDCPSPHGWHNPQALSPERIMELAQMSYGKNVDPSTIRLLTRDEVGGRENSTSDIKRQGTVRNLEGGARIWTYYTTTPYGELPPVTRYTFPECAPYGWSRKTGEKIPTPPGYELVPVGEHLDCWVRVHYTDWGVDEYNPAFTKLWEHPHIAAVFRKTKPIPKMVPYDGPEDFPPELRSGGLWLRQPDWWESCCRVVTEIFPDGITAANGDIIRWKDLHELGYLLSADRINWITPAKEAK